LSTFANAKAATSRRTQKMQPIKITVRACKYDGVEHRRWPATILRQEGSLLVLDAKFDQEIQHDLLGTIAAGTTSIEYYWLDRWYNVFRFTDPQGNLTNHYCNINVPPTFDGQLLSYVDLDTDILVQPDYSYQILDLEEFEENALRYGYSSEVRLNAERALSELITLIESRAFPFNE
jgi:protein associated with RNAse G/E